MQVKQFKDKLIQCNFHAIKRGPNENECRQERVQERQ